ncbi:MAG TPA: SDR family NAD(P)-dependent oxidoreductase, partial [Rhabdochlamydiaceae bacterium]|nr:SDR family NAD(P)-dependent oxidoreductase [Rhabdochlamydiaceae bacterium]
MKKIVLLLGMLMTSLIAQDVPQETFKRFQDQVVIVTGASKGIGKGIAKLFASEGAKLVVVGRDEKALEQLAGELSKTEVLSVRADVSSSADIERVVQETLARYGRIDVLCHNAGIYPQARL